MRCQRSPSSFSTSRGRTAAHGPVARRVSPGHRLGGGESACTPDSVPGCPGDGHPSRPAVTRRLLRPTRGLAGGQPIPLLGLAPGGVCRAAGSPPALVRSYRTVSPLPVRRPTTGAIGGLFSVALSCGSPRLGVTQHPALWSPDVPRPGHLAGPGRGRSGQLVTVTILAAPAGPCCRRPSTRRSARPIVGGTAGGRLAGPGREEPHGKGVTHGIDDHVERSGPLQGRGPRGLLSRGRRGRGSLPPKPSATSALCVRSASSTPCTDREKIGVWGGYTAGERRRLVRQRRRSA